MRAGRRAGDRGESGRERRCRDWRRGRRTWALDREWPPLGRAAQRLVAEALSALPGKLLGGGA